MLPAALLGFLLMGCSEPPAPATTGGPVAMSRLTEAQYRNSIADVFGGDIEIFGRFEPDHRRGRLLSVGSAWASVTAGGFEQYEAMARGVAGQVLDAQNRERFMPCQPLDASKPDDACAALFLRTIGRSLLRRPLNEDDLQPRLAIAGEAASLLEDFHSGLEFALASLLVAPEFLFRVDALEPDPGHPGNLRLDAFSRASRLSYTLWNTTPDEILLAAAERGELYHPRGIQRQVDRMLASGRLEQGVRALFSDMLELDQFGEVAKDATIYPAFTSAAAADAREQTLKTLVAHLVKERGDYRDLFTLKTFPMTRSLAMIYGVPVSVREGWEWYRFPDEDARAGLHSQLAILAQHSHPGRSSPTLRGSFVREAFMCQPVPPPPADVDFTLSAEFEVLPTARERLRRHSEDLSCKGCHQLMDPVGLALENFDGIGAFRTHENGTWIDTHGDLDGVDYEGAAGLAVALSRHPAVPACLVDTVYRYAVGREIESGERAFVSHLENRFARSGYRLPDLLRETVTSEAFFTVSGWRGE